MKNASEARDETSERFNRIVEQQTNEMILHIETSIQKAIDRGKYALQFGLVNTYYKNRSLWPDADMIKVFYHFRELGYSIEYTRPLFWFRKQWLTITW